MRGNAFFLAGIIVAGAAPALAAEEAACALERRATVDLSVEQQDGAAYLTIPVLIKDMPAKAILNLSSVFNMTHPSAVEAHGLGTRSYFTGAQVTTATRTLNRFSMQVPVRIDQVPLALDLVHYPDSDGFHDADIALGMSAFTHLDFELDFAAGKMYLYSQSRCGAGVVHWADNFARVPMRDGYLVAELNGQKIETGLATAAGATWLDAEAASTLFDIVLSIADGDSQDFVFMSLTAEGIEIMDANLQIAGVDHGIDCRLHSSQGRDRAAGYFGCENSYPFNLGLDIIQTMHLYFATRERALYFTHRDDRRTAP